MNAVLVKDSVTSIAQLSQLLQLHAWSLPMYLANARPWIGQQQRHSAELLEQIAHDHHYMVAAIGARIVELGGSPRQEGGFSMEFTDLHDLSANFVLTQVIQYQAALDHAIQDCITKLQGDPESQSLAYEAAGLARGHRELLVDLVATPPLH